MRIIIVADNASKQFGGEAFIPLNYFRFLLARQEDVRLVVHARNRPELTQEFPDDLGRLHFVDDTKMHKALFRFSRFLPRRLADATTGLIIHLSTQLSQRRIIRDLVSAGRCDVVHQPTPVSPKTPSLMWGLGAAVVIGPLNGGMDYPEAFRRERSIVSRLAFTFGRWLASFANAVLPGKRRADMVLVANDRTRQALPHGIKGRIIQLVENGVDFSIWQHGATERHPNASIEFIFVGRLIDWKALDLVLEAIGRLKNRFPFSLEVIGDGPMREAWQTLSNSMGLNDIVRFSGWMSQEACAARLRQADVLVLPSLFECGGAVVLEAMAMGLPVIATAWGGPIDYLDDSCGILIDPASREALVVGFCNAMIRLAESPDLRTNLGQAGYARARLFFDWQSKINEMLALYALATDCQKQSKDNRPVSN
jgi:glycosyltransferase involved in cell wall biosynthesis